MILRPLHQLAFTAAIFSVLPLAAQTSSSTLAAQTPSAGRTIALPLGSADAVTGNLSLNIPIGPRLPGRIPIGFNWSYQTQGGLFAPASASGGYQPVIWPSGGDPSANLQTTVWVSGEPWIFYPQVQNPSMPTDPSWWLSTMSTRGVTLHTPVPGDPAPNDWTIRQPGVFHFSVAPSSDGTKFLVTFGFAVPVEKIDRLTGVVTDSSKDLGRGFAVLNGSDAIWVQYSDQTYPISLGQTQDRISHFSNSWGDHVTVDETLTQRTSDCWSLEKIVISDQKAPASITLQVQFNGAPHVVSGPYSSTSSDTCTSRIDSMQATLLVTSNIGGLSLPQVTMSGNWAGTVRHEILPAPECPGYDVNAVAHPILNDFDWCFYPLSLKAQADGGSRTTSLTWPMYNGFVNGRLATVTLPGGLVEDFSHLGGSADLSQFSFSPCNGYWAGFSVTHPTTVPAYTIKAPVNDDVTESTLSSGRIILSDPSDPNPSHGQTILFSSLCPFWTSIGGGGFQTLTLTQPLHVTTVLRYASSAPDGNTAFRGIRLTHPSFDDVGSDYQGLMGYLFATSAIVQEDLISGTGVPSNLDAPSGWQPSGAATYQTTIYDGFDLHSWANPSGALGTSLPVNPIARRTRIYAPGLPTKVILAGDPGDSAACDDRGPVRTDEWTGPTQPAPSASTALSQSANSSQVNSGSSALANAVHRKGQITRHFDWNLLRLLTDSDQKTLDGGSTLQAMRGVSRVDFGSTQFSYDAVGRIKDQIGTRGAFVAKEHRDYNGNLPQISATTKSLTQGGTALYPNPSIPSVVVGEQRTFDTTYYQWTKTETNKVDGRATTYNTRDAVGRVTQETAPTGIVTDTTYNAWGQVSSVTREGKGGAGPVSTVTTYDPNGRWKKNITNADGKSFMTYTSLDAFGRVLEVDAYDASGKLASYQTFDYDGFGQKIAQSPVLKAGMNSWGNETWAYDGQGRITDHWDAQHRLLMHMVQQPTWGSAGGVTGIVITTQNDWDLQQSPATQRSEVMDILGQKIAVVDQKGQTSTYAYDQDGHLIHTYQGNQVRSYSYNDMGWLTSRTEPEEGSTFYSNFTMLGTPLLTTQTGRSGSRSTTFTTQLDSHLQPNQITASGPEGSVSRILSYDYGTANTHLLVHVNEAQTIAGLPSQAVSEGYGYDALGRLLTKTISDGDDGFVSGTPTATQTFTISQTLSDGGQVTSLTYPSGGGKTPQTATIAYDTLNRPQTVKLDGSLRGMMNYGLGSGDTVTDTLILGNGAQTVSTNTRGDLVLSQHLAKLQAGGASAIIENNAMTWSAGGLMLSRGADTFDYDSLQRLSHSRVVGLYGETEEQWYAYDAYGNRVQSNFQYTAASGSTQPTEALAWQGVPTNGNDLPTTLTALNPGAPGSASTGSLATGALYDDVGRLSQVWTTPGQSSTLTTWVYDPSGRVMKENGTTYLLEASGLRFKRTKADGTVDYTVYGFGREPLAQFEIPAPAPVRTTTTLASSKTSSGTRTTLASTTLPPDPAGAYITQPSGPATVAPGQVLNFQGGTDYGQNFTWTFGDGGATTGLTASHAFTTVGTYTVVFKASATGYTTTQATVTITVIAKPSITGFTASPGSVTSGQTSTLSWSVTGATSLSLDNGIGPVTGTTSKAVTPAVSTTYTLTATNAAGSVTAIVTVAVSAPAPPSITSYTASPSTIATGHSTTLNWMVTGGAAVSISGIGSQSGTSVSVSPATTTSYTLTAINAAGSATATITVTVETQAPLITDFWSNPVQITSGQTASLNWDVSLADTMTLDNGIGTVTGSAFTVSPPTTTTYKLTATNLVGSVSATVTISVGTPGSLVWKKTMVYGFGQELAEDQPGMGTTFIQSDFVGSPSVTTAANGTVIGRSKALPFGERYGSWGQKTVRRYTNHEDDPDSGAIYMQAREYLPAYGKFAQVDPAYDQTKDDPESWNLYNYVTNNPVTHTDPDGRIDAVIGASAAQNAYNEAMFPDDTWAMYCGLSMFDSTGGGSSISLDQSGNASISISIGSGSVGYSRFVTIESTSPSTQTGAQTGNAGFGVGGTAAGATAPAGGLQSKSVEVNSVQVILVASNVTDLGKLESAFNQVKGSDTFAAEMTEHKQNFANQPVIVFASNLTGSMAGFTENNKAGAQSMNIGAKSNTASLISINVNLTYYTNVRLANGQVARQLAPLDVVLAHEFGHTASDQYRDRGAGVTNQMIAIDRWENPYRAERGMNPRSDYNVYFNP